MRDDEFKRELERLAARLERLERTLNIEPEAPAPAASEVVPPIQPAKPPPAHYQPSNERVMAMRRMQAAEAQRRALDAAKSAPPAAPPPSETPVPAAAPPPVPPPKIPPAPIIHDQETVSPYRSVHQPPARELKESVSLEMLIGGKWMAWVGAIVVLLAVAFAILVGIQRGWWGQLLPQVRCLLIAGFGVLMLVGGEIALRRIGRAASVGCFAAGLGTLYMDAYATFRFFNLLSVEWAFVLMAVVAVVGFAITWRTRFLTIGVLSIIGGFATPWLLRGQQTHDLELLSYLTMLLGIALGLSAASPRDFRPLRFVALGALAVTGGFWIIANASSQWLLAIIFMSVWWAGVISESLLAALRRQTSLANVVAVVLSTAAFVTAGCWVLTLGPPGPATVAPGAVSIPGLLVSNWLGLFNLIVAILGAVAALHFGPGLDGLRRPPQSAMDKLAVALWAQFGVLLSVAIALQFRGFAESIGWMTVGLAGIEIGRRLPSRGVTVFGLVVGALALIRVITLDWWVTPGMNTALWTLGEITITKWSILALATIVAMHIAAHRLRPGLEAKPEPLPIFLAGAAAVFWLILASLHCDGLTATGAWLVAAIVLLALAPFGRRQRYFEFALVVLMVTAGRWLMVDAFLTRLDPRWSAAESWPLLNWQMGLALAIAVVGWWAYRIMRRRELAPNIGDQSIGNGAVTLPKIMLAAAIFALIALSFETDRMVGRMAAASTNLWWSVGQIRQLSLTLLWTIGSMGIAMLARWIIFPNAARGPQLLLQFAWGLLILCALKWVIGDALYWTMLSPRPNIVGALPIANLQMLVGAAIAIVFVALAAMTRSGEPRLQNLEFRIGDGIIEPSQWAPVVASIMLLWGLTFEVDRALARLADAPHWLTVWQPVQQRFLWWTALWALGGIAMMFFGWWRKMHAMFTAGWAIIAGAALAWLTIDTLVWRMNAGVAPAAVVLNLQFMIGALLVVLLAVAVVRLRGQSKPVDESASRNDFYLNAAWISLGLIAAVGLWAGSLEIDRFFIGDPMSVQVGLSVYWGAYGVLMVLIGFSRRAPAARYLGLALLGVTLIKAFAIDMKEVELVWRAMIFGVLGLLLIGTSMLYLKLSPRLMNQRDS